MPLTEQRKREIAVKILEAATRKKAKSTIEAFSRDLGNVAKEANSILLFSIIYKFFRLIR